MGGLRRGREGKGAGKGGGTVEAHGGRQGL
jgi:hypothetical protein